MTRALVCIQTVYIFLLDCEPFSYQCLSVIIRDVFFLWWVVSIFPLVYHLSFEKYFFIILKSYKSLLLLVAIQLGTVLMNLSKSVILWHSPFLSNLHEVFRATKGMSMEFLETQPVNSLNIKNACVPSSSGHATELYPMV